MTIPNISGEQRDKLTHAGIYGVDASMATLEQLYGIDISYYARVNFTSLITIVDALGGVDVNSEYAFSAGGYDFVQGTIIWTEKLHWPSQENATVSRAGIIRGAETRRQC